MKQELETVWKERKPEYYAGEDAGILELLLGYRGIKGEDNVFDFVSPSEEHLHDAKGMRNMVESCKRIIKAVKNNEFIIISGDPDVDGITTAIQMYKYITDGLAEEYNRKANVKIIYSQREDGHGISTQLTLDFKDNPKRQALNERNIGGVKNASLLIIVDSSSNDVEGIKLVREINPDIDIIIYDHHDIEDNNVEDVDDNLILVNPQHQEDTYPNKDLSGAGVVWKALTVMDGLLGMNEAPFYMDLCAVGMLGDVMKVDNLENRYLILSGLSQINNVGLKRIFVGAQKDPKFNTLTGDDIGFTVAPILNASARLGQIHLAYALLNTSNDKSAMKIRRELIKMNEERKEKQIGHVEGHRAEVAEISAKHNVIVLVANDSDKGFNGLIAQTFSEEFQKPCFIGKVGKDNIFRGSGRSFNGLNTQEFFNQFEYAEATGHPESHGVEFPYDKLPEILEGAKTALKSKTNKVTHYYDVELTLDEVVENMDTLLLINRLTGRGFPKLDIVVKGIDIESRDVIGSKLNTIKFKLSEEKFELLKFHVDENYATDIDFMSTVNVLGTPSLNKFYHGGLRRMVYTPQILLKDIKEV